MDFENPNLKYFYRICRLSGIKRKKDKKKDKIYCPGTRIYSCIKDTFAAFKEQGIKFIFSVASYRLLLPRHFIPNCNTAYFTPQFFFSKHKVKANSNVWMTLKSSVVIFQALKPLQPQWPQWPQQPQWPQWPQQPHFIKKFTDPDGLIIPSTQMTNISPFLWHGSSKIPFFTDIWYFFCWRLLRPAYVIFLNTDWWNSNFQTTCAHYES